jgi:hypothetical protein
VPQIFADRHWSRADPHLPAKSVAQKLKKALTKRIFGWSRFLLEPDGAKGIGELPMDGAAPAILNAIENATGVSFTAFR